MKTPIPVIDIFAGPGGLGEGFSSLKGEDGKPLFKIKLSIEKDQSAHDTLELRAFYRQFSGTNVPHEYYEYLRKKISKQDLFSNYPREYEAAKNEVWKVELGKKNRERVRDRIAKLIKDTPNWVLIGGPPCQAYSLVGRSRIRGGSKRKYREDRRHYLYKEYLQILADHQPPVFVMENVKGLLSSRRVRTENTFELILADLKQPNGVKRKNSGEILSYELFSLSKKREPNRELAPRDYLIRSEEYGIPQSRHRVIILGIRSDIFKNVPETLSAVPDRISVEEVIGDLPRLRSGISKGNDSSDEWVRIIKSIAEKDWLESEKLGSELKRAVLEELEQLDPKLSRGAPFMRTEGSEPVSEKSDIMMWYLDSALGGICNHEARSHIPEDLHRYFFASVFARLNGYSPTLNDFPSELLPKHKNVPDALEGSYFNDRFRVQVSSRPSTTVVSHISKDGHYYIHYDPSQCRSLTVREAARLQTFPDNYYFEGNRTQQYQQVGNAVPPLLACQIAGIVAKILEAT